MEQEKSKYDRLLEGDWGGYPNIESALDDYIKIYIDNNPATKHKPEQIYSWIRLSPLWQKEWGKELEAKRAWIFSLVKKILNEGLQKAEEPQNPVPVKLILPGDDEPGSTSIRFPDGHT